MNEKIPDNSIDLIYLDPPFNSLHSKHKKEIRFLLRLIDKKYFLLYDLIN
ncbi:hypothetical protein [Brachyspira aalborgi]|nr:hypothetical protein [Brachyspira aalborgi]